MRVFFFEEIKIQKRSMDEEDVEEEDDDDVLLTKFGGPEPRAAPMDKTALSFVYNLSKAEENKKDEGTRRRVVEVQKSLPVSTTTLAGTPFTVLKQPNVSKTLADRTVPMMRRGVVVIIKLKTFQKLLQKSM